jgi:hypothetical protein
MVIKMVLRILTIGAKKLKDPILVYNHSFQICESNLFSVELAQVLWYNTLGCQKAIQERKKM